MIKEELSSVNRDLKEAKDLRKMMVNLEGDILEFLLEENQYKVYKIFKEKVEDYGVRAFQEKVRVIRLIEKVEDERERFILVERYVNGRDWGGIIEDMFYSERRVYELHRSAIKSYSRVLEEDEG